MTILGVDTSTAIASVALIEDGTLVGEETHVGSGTGYPGTALPGRRTNHAESLVPLIQSLLSRLEVPWEGISALAVSIGPGSFTGLRIGLSTVKGLAYGWEVPVVGVPTLWAMAFRVTGWKGLVCPLLDARKKEVYTALFRMQENGILVRLAEDEVCPPEVILQKGKRWAGEPCLFIGDGMAVYGEAIRSLWGEGAVLSSGESYPSTAYAVARLAAVRLKERAWDSAGQLAPVYLRPSEAEIKKGPGHA